MEDGEFSFSSLQQFIERWTDLEAKKGVDLISEDYLGPLPSYVDEPERDWYLIAAWLIILLALGYFGAGTPYGRGLWQFICTNFREANDQ